MKEKFEKSYHDYHCSDESTRASDDISILYDTSAMKEESKALMEKSTTFQTEGEPNIEEDFVAEIEESTHEGIELVDNSEFYQNYPRESHCEMLDGNQIICDLDPAHSEKLIRRSIPNKKKEGRILELGLGQGRVGATVLCKNWSEIIGVEPCKYLRDQAELKEIDGKKVYKRIYDC